MKNNPLTADELHVLQRFVDEPKEALEDAPLFPMFSITMWQVEGDLCPEGENSYPVCSKSIHSLLEGEAELGMMTKWLTALFPKLDSKNNPADAMSGLMLFTIINHLHGWQEALMKAREKLQLELTKGEIEHHATTH